MTPCRQTFPPEESQKPRTRLTWEDCIRIALAHNPDLEVFRDDVLNSDAVRRGAYSLLYPQISLSAGLTRSYTGPGLYAPSSYANEFSEQASLSQTIFNGFLTQGNIAQARAQLALAFANLDSQKALTSYDLKTAFAQVIYAQQNVAVARQRHRYQPEERAAGQTALRQRQRGRRRVAAQQGPARPGYLRLQPGRSPR